MIEESVNCLSVWWMYACIYLLWLVDIQQIGHYLKWNFPMTRPTNPVCWSVSQLVCHNFLRASSFHALLILERLFLYSDNSQSVCTLVCPSVCMSVCPYVYPSVRLLSTSVGLSVQQKWQPNCCDYHQTAIYHVAIKIYLIFLGSCHSCGCWHQG